jgi:FkbM family methyltransferase
VLYIKRRYPDAEILAFEPAPQSAAVLRQNIGLHGLTDITVHEVALGSQPEQAAAFTYYPAIPANSTRYPEQSGPARAVLGRIYSVRVAERLYQGRDITVPVERLSAFLTADRPVDLLKIDVEGAELDVLLSIDPAQWPLIRQTILEVQEDAGLLAAVCDLLSSHGLEPSVGPRPQSDTDGPACIVHAVRR